MKAKSRDTGWNAESSSAGLARVGLCLAAGIRSRNHLERHQRTVGAQGFQRARMQLAEIAENVLRADLDRSGTPGMQPAWSTRHDLQRLTRGACGGEHRERIGFRIERVGRRRARPMAAHTLRGRKPWRTPAAATN